MNRLLAFVLLVLVAIVPAHAQSVTLTVNPETGTISSGMTCPSPADSAVYSNIQAALNCAPAGATLHISRGTYAESLSFARSVVLQGESGQRVELVGSADRPVISAAEGITLVLEDLSLTNGAGERGGGVFMPSGMLRLARVTLRGNTATVAGAGIYLGRGQAEISDSTFTRNSVTAFSSGDAGAEAVGGAIFIGEGKLVVVSSDLTDNTVAASSCGQTQPHARGSAIFSDSAQVILADVRRSGRALTSNCGGAAQTSTADDAILSIAAGLLTETDAASVDFTISVSTQVRAADPAAVRDLPAQQIGDEPTLALAWMGAAMESVRAERLAPPQASRIYAYTAITLYESLLPGRESGVSMARVLNGGLAIPAWEAGLRYDWPTVANAALYRATSGLFASASSETLSALGTTRDRLNMALGDYVPVNVFNRSVAYGDAVGAAILEWAARDNFQASRSLTYILPVGDPGYWVPLEGQRALEPFWGILRPFALQMPNDCEIVPPFQPSTAPESQFYAGAMEVYETVQNLTAEQREIALFWADNPGETATPPGHWISIIGIVVRQRRLSLAEAADLYALTGVAVADAFISAWHTKYRENWVRPVTYIRAFIDPDFQTVVATPPFPEYPSGHSISSGAASAVLTQLIGDIPFDDTTHLSRGLAPRHFDTFEEMAIEAATSRLYGGIHYRSSNEIGLEMGRCIGRRVLNRWQQ